MQTSAKAAQTFWALSSLVMELDAQKVLQLLLSRSGKISAKEFSDPNRDPVLRQNQMVCY